MAPLAYGVRTLVDSVTRRRLYVFEERRTRGGEWPNGWGMYVIAAGSSRPLLVEVAHPVHDVNTPQVGVQAFRDGRAAALLVAGTTGTPTATARATSPTTIARCSRR